MPRQGLTEVLFVVDQSGSMANLVEDVIGGFNCFLEDQRKLPGLCYVTLTLFASRCHLVYKCKPIHLVPKMDRETYQPGGNTALLDAIGTTIVEAGQEYGRRQEADKPEKVIMVIVTDGEENASRKYAKVIVKALIEQQQRDWGWQFVYLGANQDAFAEAGRLGVSPTTTANFRACGQSVSNAYAALSDSVKNFRATGDASLDDKQY